MCVVTRVDIGLRARSWAVFCVSVVESRCVHVQNRLWCCNRCNNGWRTCSLHQPLVYGKSLSPSAYHIGIVNSRPGFISQTDLSVSCICFVGEKLGAFLYPVHKFRWYFFPTFNGTLFNCHITFVSAYRIFASSLGILFRCLRRWSRAFGKC